MLPPLVLSLGIFTIAAFAIAIAGTRMSQVADRLADQTGLGEAIIGAVLLGGSTSLPGIVTSVTAAATGHPALAISNAVGGIAVQTAFLSIADIVYRRANLEHAAASAANLIQGALLITLLTLPLLAANLPGAEIFHIHIVSFVLLAAYGFGLTLVSSAHTKPMWGPKQTLETRLDEPDLNAQQRNTFGPVFRFGLLAAITGVAGFAIAESGIAIAQQTGLSESIVGSLLTAISTSLPELVTAIAAVQQGALTLAIGDIIGGNSFDVLFLAFADFAYREGAIYRALSNSQQFLIALTLLMTGVLLLGLLKRERRGIGGIGFESFLILILYLGGFVVISFGF